MNVINDRDQASNGSNGSLWTRGAAPVRADGLFSKNYLPERIRWWQPYQGFNMKEPEQRAIDFVDRVVQTLKQKWEKDFDLDCDCRPGAFEGHHQVFEVRIYDQSTKTMGNAFSPIAMIRIIHPPQPRFQLLTPVKDKPNDQNVQDVLANELAPRLLASIQSLHDPVKKGWPLLPLQVVQGGA